MNIFFEGHNFDFNQPVITGKDLKVMRMKAEKSQIEVANYMGIKSRKTIENWESGTSQPGIGKFVKLANFLGLHPDMVVKACVDRAKANDPSLDHNSIDWTEYRL